MDITEAMGFEIKLTEHNPIITEHIDEILEKFLLDIGYLSGRRSGDEVYGSVPFRLWKDVFLDKPDKFRTIDEMATILETSKPTIYRHLNKLKDLKLIEEKEITIEDNGEVVKKAYRLRQGDLTKAWHITELNMQSNIKRYRETVERINSLASGEKIIRSQTCPKCGEEIKVVDESREE